MIIISWQFVNVKGWYVKIITFCGERKKVDMSYIIRKRKKTEIFESMLRQCAQKENRIL